MARSARGDEAAREDGARALIRAAQTALAIAGVLPWIVPVARAYLPLGAAGVWLDALFASVCHRVPERSLVLAGVIMPLCSRCAGVFAGMATGAISVWPALSRRGDKLAITASCVFMLIDVVTQDLGIHPIWHATRIATGFAFGHLAGAAAIRALRRDAEGYA